MKRKWIVAVALCLALVGTPVYAQTQEQYQSVLRQLISLLTQQIVALQAQLALLQSQEMQALPAEPVQPEIAEAPAMGAPAEPVEEIQPVIQIGTSTYQGRVFDSAITASVGLTITDLVIAIKDQTEQGLVYPNQGVLLLGKDNEQLFSFKVRECMQSPIPDYVCPGKEVQTAAEREALPELGLVSRKPYTLEPNIKYTLVVPPSGRIVYIKGTDKNGQVVEIAK